MDELPWQAQHRQQLAAELRKLNDLLDAGRKEEAKEHARRALPLALLALERRAATELSRKLRQTAEE